MAIFEDRQSRKWTVALDVPLLDEVQEKQEIDLVDLEKDPLIQLRSNPRKIVEVIYILCQDQIEKLSLSPKDFAKALPAPPDPMLDAITEAIVDFFPSGRASSVREVLTKYNEMTTKTDAIVIAKMTRILNDPEVERKLNSKADREIDRAMKELLPD